MMTRDRNNTSNHPMMKMALRSLLLVLVVVSLLLALVSEAAFVPSGDNRPAWSRRTTTTTTSSTSTILYVQDREKILREEIEQRNNMIQNEKKYAVADGELLDQQRFAGSLDSSEGILATVATSSPTVTSVLAAKEERDKNDDDTTTTETDNVAAATASTSTATLERPAVVAAVTTTEAATTSSSTSTSSPSDVPVEKTKTGLAARMERLTKPRAYPLFLAEKAAEIVEAAIHDMSTMLQGDVKTTSLDDSSGSSSSNKNKKERIVILGTGWGAASFLKTVDTDLYTVTVISPRNYFVFTPMLAGASVGTVEYRSITEPIREICPGAEYLEATASDIDPVNRLVTCQSVVCDGNSCQVEDFQVSYDKVIVTVGAQTNTFGIPGVREYCCFLKQVEDARRIRTAIVNCFERANLPHLSEQERVDNLTFCVIGAGPTGIEFAAELRDFVEQDAPKYYPSLLKYVRIKVIEASSTILAPFDKSLQDEAIKQMNRAPSIRDADIASLLPERFKLTELLLDSSVKEVTANSIRLNDGNEIRYGLSVWAAGNGPLALTLQVIEALGDEQAQEQKVARGRVAIDPWMRAVGGGGKIFALGDCSCIVQGGQQLPATAQVASQQSEYLASLMNRKFNFSPTTEDDSGIFPPPIRDAQTEAPTMSDIISSFATNNKDHEFAKAFQFLNLGILAYTGGGSALAQVAVSPDTDPVKSSGQIGNLLWRSVYLSKQVSWRNRLLVLNDWAKRVFFGRDITRI